MLAEAIHSEKEPGWIWWKHGIVYHIYPRSFFDSNGDGIGDLQGIICKLPYLTELGVDAIWLSPVYTSPNVDFGYDVSDYRGINPEYGTMEDFRKLLSACHQKGIRVIMDMILNHTSSKHPWFLESRSFRDNEKRDWYIWRKGVKGGPPNNWKAAVGGSAWEFDLRTGMYYLHSFFPEQPDLNWRNPKVVNVFFEELKFWLDMGVDGFRLDVINMIGKDKKFRNNPFFLGIPILQKHVYNRNRPKSLKIVKKVRELLNQYDERAAIGEVYTMPPGNPKAAARYLGKSDNGIHLAFDFSLIFSKWDARHYYSHIANWYSGIPDPGWPCNVLSNHDLFRSINRRPLRKDKEEKAKISAFLLLTLKGTPFIYYGEEIGMKNGNLTKKEIKDPLGKKYWPFFKGRDKARTPMQWTAGRNGGFTEGNPWLPLNTDFHLSNVNSQWYNPNSILWIYRSLIRLRKEHPALQDGLWIPVQDGRKGLLAYLRKQPQETLLVVLNFKRTSRAIKLKEFEEAQVLLSTCRREGDVVSLMKLKLFPFEATICKIYS